MAHQDVTAAPILSRGYPRGIDVSSHQGEIDWPAVAATGLRFVFIRAFEGKDEDKLFRRNWAGAGAAGLLRSAYQYDRARHTGDRLAVLLLDLLGEVGPGELPPVIDVETLDGRTPEELVVHLLEWSEVVGHAIGRDPIFYTYPDFWGSTMGRRAGLEHLPLWIAHYTDRAPTIPPPWGEAICWQHTRSARVEGIRGDVDGNVWLSDEASLRAWASPPAPPALDRATVLAQLDLSMRVSTGEAIEKALAARRREGDG